MSRSVLAGALVVACLAGGAVAAAVIGPSTPYERSRVTAPALVAWRPAPPGAPDPDPSTAAGRPGLVSTAWVDTVAAATGMPPRVLSAYADAEIVLSAEQPGCGVGWPLLAGVGAVESGHGTFGDSTVTAAGVATPPIVGPALDGAPGLAALRDSDDGALDGDVTWDRAVGPLQFLPSTWRRWGADGDRDGVADPQQVDDAALAAGRYLCAAGEVRTAEQTRAALLTYNRSTAYAATVVATANRYAVASTAGS